MLMKSGMGAPATTTTTEVAADREAGRSKPKTHKDNERVLTNARNQTM